MSVCEGCETTYEKGYIYGECNTCGEMVCGWCSYDTTKGFICIKCGFSCRSADEGLEYCEKRKRFIPTKDECEKLAKKVKDCPYSHIFTPDTTPAPKKKVKLVIVKRLAPTPTAYDCVLCKKHRNITEMPKCEHRDLCRDCCVQGKYDAGCECVVCVSERKVKQVQYGFGWYERAIARRKMETEDFHAGRIKTKDIDLKCDCCRVELGRYEDATGKLTVCGDCRVFGKPSWVH